MPFDPSSIPGVLHHYSPRLVAFEHKPDGAGAAPAPQHTLLWQGGLGDGLLTCDYPSGLARTLPPSWSLVEVLLQSGYDGWGRGSLARDAAELAACVEYFRRLRPAGRLVLMGHSTGCQDTMQYLVGGSGGAKAGDAGESGVDGAMVDQGEREGTSADRGRRPKLDGAILQAPVSDREAMVEMLGGDDFSRMVREVQEQWIDAGRSDDVLPASYAGKLFGKSSAVTAYRWMSLASPDGTGDDDYFSSDLPEQQLQRTFGRLGRVAPETPVMLLYGERDQYVPGWVDKEALVRKWAGIIKQGGAALDDTNGGIVPGASHNLRGDPEHVLRDLFSRVNGFLQRIDKGDIKTAPHL